MNCALVVSISVLACAIADKIEDDNDLGLLAVALTQLGDTLATIAAQREICEGAEETPPEIL